MSRADLISAVLTVIPVGHHSGKKVPSSPSPLTPVALLIGCCPTPFIQQRLCFISSSFQELHLVDLYSYPPTVEMPGKPESLNLSPLTFIQDEQRKRLGTVESRYIFGNG